MPIEATYAFDDDDEEQEKKPKMNGPPKLDDSEAFPDGGIKTGAPSKNKAPAKSFAALSSEVLPQQKHGLDYSKPITIKMPRKPPPPRIKKVHEQYKRDETKKFRDSYALFHDEGIPAGVSEKKAPCTSEKLADISSLKDFNNAWRDLKKKSPADDNNVRAFKGDATLTPSESSGGRYSMRVAKAIAADMFEELCVYLFDGRLDHTIVGIVWCIRDKFDLIQLWTKNAASAGSVEVFTKSLHSLVGTDSEAVKVDYKKHSDVFKKNTPEARKYYIAEHVGTGEAGAAMTVNSMLKQREFASKKKEKKAGEFSEVPVKERREKKKGEDQDDAAAVETAENPFDLIHAESHAGDTGDDIEFKEKKKSAQGRKGSTKRGSKKEKKGADDFDLPAGSGPVIPQQVFVGAGLFSVLFIAVLAIFMSGALN